MSHELRARRGNLLRERHLSKRLTDEAAAANRCLAEMRRLNAQMKRLDRQLDAAAAGCACGNGECYFCRLDRAAPVIHGAMAAARECAELQDRLDNAYRLAKVSQKIKRLFGGPECGDCGMGELSAELDAVRRRHDDLMRQLCDPENGLAPEHELCRGYCATAAHT